ncbi:AAA family ATPase [Ralstonia pseudosolanacearum]
MARSDQLKALLRAHAGDDSEHFYSVALQVAADEARRGHARLAAELKDLIDKAKAQRINERSRSARPVALAQPKGELGNLLTARYPHEHLSEMVLAPEVQAKIERVLREQRNTEALKEFGLTPRGRLLLVGPPGTGKTMTASTLAGELRLPLFTVRFDSLITKFMGESAAKLRLVFDAMKQTRGVYFFDEFDSLGLQRGSQHDVAEMRRTLNTFLQLLDQDDSDSLVIAATNHAKDLDIALFRRFDDVIRYEQPDAAQAELLVKNRLAAYVAKGFDLKKVAAAAAGHSHAEISRACLDALKDAVMDGNTKVMSDGVILHLEERAQSNRG